MVQTIKKVVKEMFSQEIEFISQIEKIVEKRVDELMRKKYNISPLKARSIGKKKQSVDGKYNSLPSQTKSVSIYLSEARK